MGTLLPRPTWVCVCFSDTTLADEVTKTFLHTATGRVNERFSEASEQRTRDAPAFIRETAVWSINVRFGESPDWENAYNLSRVD